MAQNVLYKSKSWPREYKTTQNLAQTLKALLSLDAAHMGSLRWALQGTPTLSPQFILYDDVVKRRETMGCQVIADR